MVNYFTSEKCKRLGSFPLGVNPSTQQIRCKDGFACIRRLYVTKDLPLYEVFLGIRMTGSSQHLQVFADTRPFELEAHPSLFCTFTPYKRHPRHYSKTPHVHIV